MTTESADPAAGGAAAGGGFTPPTDVELEKILGDLARPVGQVLSSLSSALVQLMRTLLDQAYQRGRHDALLEATAALPQGRAVIHNTGERSEPVLTAQQLDRLRRDTQNRQTPGSERF